MATIRISEHLGDGSRAPLYQHYQGQTQAQPAYVELEEDGTVNASYDPEIGGAVPMTVWHGRDRRYPVSNSISMDGLKALLAYITPLLQRVHDGLSIEWDGSNIVGRLTEAAENAEAKISRICESDEWDTVDIMDAGEWLYPSIARDHDHSRVKIGSDIVITRYTGERRLEQLARKLEREAEADGILLDGDMLEELRSLQRQL